MSKSIANDIDNQRDELEALQRVLKSIRDNWDEAIRLVDNLNPELWAGREVDILKIYSDINIGDDEAALSKINSILNS